MWIWILPVLIVITLCFMFLRSRSKKRKYIFKCSEHPTGFLKYHEGTQTVLKKALEPIKKDSIEDKVVAVFRFKGDTDSLDRLALSHVIDEIILNKEHLSEVVFLVESPGGSVTDYGHIYSEVHRIRQSGLDLTACVDTVAASGGYLICLPASKIVAAPFAMIGSIGVVSFVPNIRRLLERFDIVPRTFTAGNYKRTVTLTDNASPEEHQHFQQQLNLIHDQFKNALKHFRPKIELEKVATGEAWLAQTTLELNLGLVDEIRCSADYLFEKNRTQDLLEFSKTTKKKPMQKLLDFVGQSGIRL